MFALYDVSSSYASCETASRPDLKGRPVVVLSDNDGYVIVRLQEVKPFAKVGEPYFEQKDTLRWHSIIAFSSNYEFYADMSSRVMITLEKLSPHCETYSTDEASCDLTGVQNCRGPTDFGRETRETALRRAYLTVGVGVVRTKASAKLVNYAAKQWQ